MEFTFKSVDELHNVLAIVQRVVSTAWPRARAMYNLRAENEKAFMEVRTEHIHAARCDLSAYLAEATNGEIGWFSLDDLVSLLAFMRDEPAVRFTSRGSRIAIATARNLATFLQLDATPVTWWPEPQADAGFTLDAAELDNLVRFVSALQREGGKTRLVRNENDATIRAYSHTRDTLVYNIMTGDGVGTIDLPATSVLAAGKLAKLGHKVHLTQSVQKNICVADVEGHRFFLPIETVYDRTIATAATYIAQADSLPACICNATALFDGIASLHGRGLLTLQTSGQSLVLEYRDDNYHTHAVVPANNDAPTATIQVEYDTLLRLARAFNTNTSEVHLKFGPQFLCLQNGTGTTAAIIAAMRTH